MGHMSRVLTFVQYVCMYMCVLELVHPSLKITRAYIVSISVLKWEGAMDPRSSSVVFQVTCGWYETLATRFGPHLSQARKLHKNLHKMKSLVYRANSWAYFWAVQEVNSAGLKSDREAGRTLPCLCLSSGLGSGRCWSRLSQTCHSCHIWKSWEWPLGTHCPYMLAW